MYAYIQHTHAAAQAIIRKLPDRLSDRPHTQVCKKVDVDGLEKHLLATADIDAPRVPCYSVYKLLSQ